MNLLSILKEKAQVAMSEFVPGLDHDLGIEEHYEAFMDQFVGRVFKEVTPWWDFCEEDLSVKNINELLEVNFMMWHDAERPNEPMPPCNVKELLRRYGVWTVRESHFYEFGAMFHEEWLKTA